MGRRALLATGVIVLTVVLPVDVSLTTDAMVPVPDPSVCLLLGSSCLLLVGSSLTLRRQEAERRLATHPTDAP